MNTTTTHPVNTDLRGKIALLHKHPWSKRRHRVLIERVRRLDADSDTAVIIGHLLYANRAYDPMDSRGAFSTLAYNFDDPIQLWEGTQP